MLITVLNWRRVLRKIIFILILLFSVSPIYAQENWGPAESVIPLHWDDICPIRMYGFSYPAVSSNDSLMFFIVDCVYTHGAMFSVYEGGEWQYPQSIHSDLDSLWPAPLFFYDQDDTLLYFVAEWDSGYGGDDIWAIQLLNDAWSDPFNLGSVINTSADESSPSLPDDESGLYFSRNDIVMYSEIIDGQFTTPAPLPPVINSDLKESDPRISRDGQKLYFNRAITSMHPDSMFASNFINGTWQDPTPLNNNINFVSYDPNCPMIYGVSFAPSFSMQGTKMYFTRFFVYGEFCEPGWDILVSEIITETESTPPLPPSTFSLSAYPNPFNNATNISVEGNLESILQITIYDITGRRVKSFIPSSQITWDGSDDRGKPVSSGIYFVKAGGAGFEKSLRITLLK
jgi:hypothetical protein